MAKDATVAPKERINIVFKPSSGDVNEEVELPLKLMMIGDYSSQENDTAIEDRPVVSVDKNNFDEILESKNLSVSMTVKNSLINEDDAEMPVNLQFKSMRDFEPDSITAQVPELQKLIELRESLIALKGPMGNVPAFRKHLQSLISDEGARSKILEELDVIAKESEEKAKTEEETE